TPSGCCNVSKLVSANQAPSKTPTSPRGGRSNRCAPIRSFATVRLSHDKFACTGATVASIHTSDEPCCTCQSTGPGNWAVTTTVSILDQSEIGGVGGAAASRSVHADASTRRQAQRFMRAPFDNASFSSVVAGTASASAAKPAVGIIRAKGTIVAQHVTRGEVQNAKEKQSEQDGFPHGDKITRFGFVGRVEIGGCGRDRILTPMTST